MTHTVAIMTLELSWLLLPMFSKNLCTQFQGYRRWKYVFSSPLRQERYQNGVLWQEHVHTLLSLCLATWRFMRTNLHLEKSMILILFKTSPFTVQDGWSFTLFLCLVSLFVCPNISAYISISMPGTDFYETS